MFPLVKLFLVPNIMLTLIERFRCKVITLSLIITYFYEIVNINTKNSVISNYSSLTKENLSDIIKLTPFFGDLYFRERRFNYGS